MKDKKRYASTTKKGERIMAKVKYVLVGFGGIAENRVAKEGYACDT